MHLFLNINDLLLLLLLLLMMMMMMTMRWFSGMAVSRWTCDQ